MTYEINLNNHQRVEENKKSIAFMALTNDDEEEESESESDEDSMEEECTNEDANMCFMTLEEHEDEVNSNSTIISFKMYFKNYILILKNLGSKMSLSRKIFLVFKMSSMSLRKILKILRRQKSLLERKMRS